MSKSFSLRNKKVWVAGHRGMVGGALVRRLERENCEILTNSLDLRRQDAVERWMAEHQPDAVVLAAARVGGIGANAAYPADFLYDNLMIEANIIHAAFQAGVEKLLFLGSSCIYPREAPQPISENTLLSGPLEPTNEWYAIAKIAGIKLCQAYRRQHGCRFIAAMPCNLYGPGDTYDEEKSHVIPALLLKMHRAGLMHQDHVKIWGTGKPLREFLYVDDLAEALVVLLEQYDQEQPVNVGSGQEISIAALAAMIADTVGYKGKLVSDPARPDGTPRKILDSSVMAGLGWQPLTSLEDGLAIAYHDYLQRAGADHAA